MRVKFNGTPLIARHHNCPTHIQQTVSFNRYFEGLLFITENFTKIPLQNKQDEVF